MATSFIEIYNRAISELDDPDLTKIFERNPESPIELYQTMYPFLQNSIPKFNNPISMINRLSAISDSDGAIETFNGSGSTKTFVVSTTPLIGSYYQFIINGEIVEGTYDSSASSVTFQYPIPLNETGSFEWYFAGQFTNDLNITEKMILGKLTICSWAEKEVNFLLDIRRLLGDTDFKLGSEANSIRAKDMWLYNKIEATNKAMQNYSWNTALYNYSKGAGFGA